jgi:hypothetical protein
VEVKKEVPSVKKNESRNKYVSRAIPILMKEGLSQAQAVGKSEGLYSAKWKQPKKKKG